MLAEGGSNKFHLDHVERYTLGIKLLREETYDAVLIDISGSDTQDLDSIKRLENTNPDLAIVVLSNVVDESFALDVVQAGAQDYLVKGQGDGFLIARTIRYAIEHKKEKQRLSYLARFDVLTGLANRGFFREQLVKALARADRGKMPMALMFLDLDRFKVINDTLGHDVGDQLLKLVAHRLQGCVRGGDIISRIGGDEFTVIQERVTRVQDVEVVAQKIINTMAQPFALEGQELFIGTSIGIALYPYHGKDADTLIKNADTAMYCTKENGRNNFNYYLPEMGAEASKRLELEHNLRKALENQEFQLYYQPQVSLVSGEIVAVEALLRWRRSDTGELVPPSDFISIAEETGMIVPIGEWVLNTACAQVKKWQTTNMPHIRVAVNLSARQFHQKELVNVVRSALRDYDLNPDCLELELTESLIMEYMQVGSTTLGELKKMGIYISIDDFGTGYSSLSCLKHLPIDTLKIDQSFINNITTDEDNAAIAGAIIAMGKSLRLNVIAEGVETKDQVSYLTDHGCVVGQGTYFNEPVPAEKFEGTFLLDLPRKVSGE